MIKYLKSYGIHHGIILMVLSWASFISYGPQIGIIVSSSIATGYVFKEYNEAQWRGFKILDRTTWKDKVQWAHFITPLVLAVISAYFMRGNYV